MSSSSPSLRHFQRIDLSNGQQIAVYEYTDGSVVISPTFKFAAEMVAKEGFTSTVKITPLGTSQPDSGTDAPADKTMTTGGSH